MSYISYERTWPIFRPKVHPYQVWSRLVRAAMGSEPQSPLIRSLSTHLTNYVYHEQTCPRPRPRVHLFQVWPRSENNWTCESGNGLSRSESFINSLSASLTSYDSNEQTRLRLRLKMSPCQVSPRSENNCTLGNDNGLIRSDWLIILLSVHLMSYVSRELLWPRPTPKVYPFQFWLWSEKNCTRESGNRLSTQESLISSLSAS